MRMQTCAAGQHNNWMSGCGDHDHDCPWCDIDRLKVLVDSQRKLIAAHGKPLPCTSQSGHGVTCQLPTGHGGPHRRHGDGVEWEWGPA